MKKKINGIFNLLIYIGIVQTILIFCIIIKNNRIANETKVPESEAEKAIISPLPVVGAMKSAGFPGFQAIEDGGGVKRMYTEWDPVQSVAVCMPLKDVLSDINKLKLYIDIFQAIASEVEVVVFVDQGDPERFSYLMHFLESPAGCRDILDNITFVESSVSLRWIRDFGPLYGQGDKGSLVLFDNIYRHVKIQPEEPGSDPNHIKRAGAMAYLDAKSDMLPVYMNAFLSERVDGAVRLVKTDLIIDGGDVFFGDERTLSTSLDTLIRNELDRDTLNARFSRQFGVERIHYLKALPGETVDHLDMLFKPLKGKKVLVPDISEYAANVNTGPVYRRHLLKEIIKAANDNTKYLQKFCPDWQTIPVPMPLPLFASRDKMIYDSYESVLNSLSLKLLNKSSRLVETNGSRDYSEILSRIVSDLGPLDANLEVRLDKILKYYLNSHLVSYLNIYAESRTAYRSYINAFNFTLKNGRQFIIVPRYTGQNAEENLKLAVMEKEVESTYRLALGDIQVKWINSDILISDQSALHCILAGIPYN